MTTVLVSNIYKAVSKSVKKSDKGYKHLPIAHTLKISHHDGHLLITPFVMDPHERAMATQPVSARWNGEEWSACVPARPFVDWLRASQLTKEEKAQHTSEQIELDLDPSTQILKIKAGNTRTEFKCIDAQEFPA